MKMSLKTTIPFNHVRLGGFLAGSMISGKIINLVWSLTLEH
jgi:hypothetical protein